MRQSSCYRAPAARQSSTGKVHCDRRLSWGSWSAVERHGYL